MFMPNVTKASSCNATATIHTFSLSSSVSGGGAFTSAGRGNDVALFGTGKSSCVSPSACRSGLDFSDNSGRVCVSCTSHAH